MKAQGKALAAVKALLDGKGDLAAAQAAGAELRQDVPHIPGVFPQKTAWPSIPARRYAKPDIWAQWDKFVAGGERGASNGRGAQCRAEGRRQGGDHRRLCAMGKDGLRRLPHAVPRNRRR